MNPNIPRSGRGPPNRAHVQLDTPRYAPHLAEVPTNRLAIFIRKSLTSSFGRDIRSLNIPDSQNVNHTVAGGSSVNVYAYGTIFETQSKPRFED